ncbi:uncharacterized protein STEHIDRAFT_138661 [Stereum hirsutum FP-91666 SS1]|uniref:uncharacterized protein n=1 Tax=Stereum hirsutum (strain FP-91666) TaxID=721885 RepID=UPI0004410444|nr:uncharacterized protein STEHIDRAFT_138661 [Stereum hirsutum FP-91666 SS1]EIM88296.1 hypothetical protein STEHIDRAFT_138661 [Stereum hirsutum FP-91666 SS1]
MNAMLLDSGLPMEVLLEAILYGVHLVCFVTAVYFVQYFSLRGYTTLLCTITLPFVLSSSHLVNNIRILRTEAELVAHFVPLEASQVVAESSPAAIAQIYFLAFNTIFTSSIVLWRASTSKTAALSACLSATLLSFTAATSLSHAYDCAYTVEAFHHPVPRFWSHRYTSLLAMSSDYLVLLANAVGTWAIVQQGWSRAREDRRGMLWLMAESGGVFTVALIASSILRQYNHYLNTDGIMVQLAGISSTLILATSIYKQSPFDIHPHLDLPRYSTVTCTHATHCVQVPIYPSASTPGCIAAKQHLDFEPDTKSALEWRSQPEKWPVHEC